MYRIYWERPGWYLSLIHIWYRERHDLDFSSKGIEEYLQKLEEAGGGGSL